MLLGTAEPLLRYALVAGSLALAPALVVADQPPDAAPATWVRVTVASEVAGEGFAMSPAETRGKVLSRDTRTVTFDVKGQAVRVARPGTVLEGTLTRTVTSPGGSVRTLDDNTLAVLTPGPILVPREAIAAVDVRQRRSRKGLGVLIGAVVGGVIGGLAATPSQPEFGGELATGGGAVVGVLGGAILGGLVAPGSKWETNVPLNRVCVSVRAGRGHGLEVHVAAAF